MSFLQHVVSAAAAAAQASNGGGSGAEELVGVDRHERHPEQAPQVVSPRPGGNLQIKASLEVTLYSL